MTRPLKVPSDVFQVAAQVALEPRRLYMHARRHGYESDARETRTADVIVDAADCLLNGKCWIGKPRTS